MLSNLQEERIIVEQDNIDESVFSPIYEKARNLVKAIRSNDIAGTVDHGTIRQEKLQIVNTISFEGRRGTGKTSAMMSFCRELEEQKQGKEHPFIVLDYIDASALEKGESILEIVLANMYQKLEECTARNGGSAYLDNKTRTILRKFEEIFTAINFIGERKDRSGRRVDVSPLSGLERLSNSQKLKKQVYELVKEFVSINNNTFEEVSLVIPIDDIDMCFQSDEPSVYEVMETLHRYLMIPKVIILLTYDYPELLSGCEKHFAQMYYKRHTITDDQKKHINEAANRYLEKVLPTYARIHLPSQQKRDYSDQNNIQVCIDMTKDDEKKYLGGFVGFIPDKDKEVTLNPKKFAFLLKAANCGLFYDSCGEKRHYVEPSDFRDMVHIVTMCKQLSRMFVKNKEAEDDIVFKELFDDLYFRFARIHLNPREYERYNNYLKVNIERRSRDILKDISRDIQEKKDSNKKVVRESSNRDNYDNNKNEWSEIRFVGAGECESYSYGELLYGLYLASHSEAFSKPLIWCILESYTIMLTKLYRAVNRAERKTWKGDDSDILYKPEEVSLYMSDNEAYKIIKGIIGLSISSSWSNCFVPKIASSYHGKKRSVNTHNFNVPGGSRSSRAGAIRFMYSDSGYSWEFKPKKAEEEKEIIIQTIEIMCMFFSDVKSVDDKAGFAIKIGPEINGISKEEERMHESADQFREAKKEKYFTFTFSDACFNIMNFVSNLYMGEEFFYLLYHESKMNLKYYLKEFFGINDAEIDKWVSEYSLYKKFLKWKDDSDAFNGGRYAMPLYSFDMMYNIMKRQYLKVKPYNGFKVVDSHGFLNSLLKTYEDLYKSLSKQDEFYFCFDEMSKNNKERHFLAKTFEKSPFIEYMFSVYNSIVNKKEDNRIDYLETFFSNLALNVGGEPDTDNPQK